LYKRYTWAVVAHVCSLLTVVCTNLDGLNAEDKFRIWITMSCHFTTDNNRPPYIIWSIWNSFSKRLKQLSDKKSERTARRWIISLYIYIYTYSIYM